MENRIYPNWEQLNKLRNPLTEGEKALLKYLDDNLPRDTQWKSTQKQSEYKGWLIFAQPFLNGSRPDIVIFNPYVGIVIYEVKDWQLKNYEWDEDINNKKQLYFHDSNGRHPIKSPADQVNHYKEKIIGQLVPIIGESIDKNKLNYGLIKTALYFHKIKTYEARDFYGAKGKSFSYFPVFGYNDLVSGKLSEIVPDVEYTKKDYWDRKWNEEIMFWLLPPFHSLEQAENIKLKYNQEKVGEPKPGHYRVRGVAGSGKTQALAFRAGKLASIDMDVLIITFNITLWHYIKDMIQRSPFRFKWDKITFTHFHGFCKEKLNKAGVKWPSSPRKEDFDILEEYEIAREYFFEDTVPEAVITAIKNTEYDKYDAILIDEGQDYQYAWYNLLNSYFMKTRDELLVVCDKKQNIYERNLDWIDKRVTKKGLEKFKDPYIDLTHTFRMPRKVAELSNMFSETFELNQDLKVSKIEEGPVLVHTQHIIWLNIDEEKWLYYVYSAFLRLKKEEYHPSEIVILLPNHKYGNECINYFKEKNIEVNHVFEEDEEARFHIHKKAFWMGDSRLKMSTIHSFKGWELLNIVIYIPKKATENNKKLDSVIYTAITRTRENLIVINANQRYNKFGEKYPIKWNDQDRFNLD